MMTRIRRIPCGPRPWLLAAACALLTATACVDAPAPGALQAAIAPDPVGAAAAAAERALGLGFAGAERVLIGTVERVSAAFGENEHGDRLILSTVALRVEETLRGPAAAEASFELEGGTVGDLTLAVSDLPTLQPGDRGAFALRRSAAGVWVPNGRGLGVVALAPDADLRALRRAEELTR